MGILTLNISSNHEIRLRRLIGATAAQSVKADCDLTKLKVATFTDNACATAATGNGAEAALKAFLEANKGATAEANTIGAVNANNLCVQAYQQGETGADQKNYGGVCTSSKYTFYAYVNTDTTCQLTTGAANGGEKDM